MKKIIIAAAVIVSSFTAGAQTSTNQTATAVQSANLALSNAIAITFVNSSSRTGGNDVNLVFQSVTDYANGVVSGEQQMLVQSNKHFNVSMKTSTHNFTYTGTTTPAPVVQISNVLQMMVTENNTGGSLSYNNYASIPSGSATIINWGRPGGDRTFSIKYKAIPGFALSAGTYSADVVYTATQP